jgi:hypothetical protein
MTNDKKATEVVTEELDLATLDTTTASDAGARIPIVHPITKEPIGIFIDVLGKHSTAFRELVRERINTRVKTESMAAKRGKTLDPKTAEEVEREALEMLVACTTGWGTEIHRDNDFKKEVIETKPTILFQGEHLTWNAQNGLLVYSKMLWLREQVDEAIGDLENFIKA